MRQDLPREERVEEVMAESDTIFLARIASLDGLDSFIKICR
jgi:hypothetical protein